MWRNLSFGLLLLGVGVTPVTAAQAPTFETVTGLSAGVEEDVVFPPAVPAWWDITGDGAPDLLSLYALQMTRAHQDDAGALTMVPIATGDVELGAYSAVSPVDADGDGVNELVVVGRDASLLTVQGVDHLGKSPLPMPAFRARGTNDIAVGDLNRDGLPDLYMSIGLTYPERMNLQGRPDTILMNRGEGRFEAIDAKPTRVAMTNSVTLADVDGDGWLDAIESVDTSYVTGRSRLLFNRTQPGDTHPTFVAAEEDWDPGTDGMGVAVADIDGDGHLDLYGTSIGHDVLAMGLGDGRFEDATYAKLLLHQWSSSGLRSQWSPTFVDLDLDGHLDLLIRHGMWQGAGNATQSTSWAEDLVYTQGEDGTFSRRAVPAQPGVGGGIRFVAGDLDSDGRPDAGRDGHAADVLVWHNTTPVDADTRLLTVRFAATVSGSPPTGTIVEGTCGDVTHTRHLTSGGKMGGSPAYEVSMAWPGCGDATVDVRVRWPSGAVTNDPIPADVTAWRAEEPRWLQEGAGSTVILDPTGTGAEEACLEMADGSWSCCAARCELARPATGAAIARLDDRTPMSLPPREASWLLVTTPHLPRPGFNAKLHLLHVGSAETFPGGDAILHLDGVPIPWDTVDEATRSLTTSIKVDHEAATLSVSLTVNDQPVGSWSRSVGVVFDSVHAWTDAYPIRPIGSGAEDGNWSANFHPAPGISHSGLVDMLTISTADGSEIESAEILPAADAFRWVSLAVPWSELGDVDALFIRDRRDGPPLTLPVIQPPDTEALLEHVDSARCGLVRNRVMPSLGRVRGILTLFDEAGHVMRIPQDQVELEVQGGTITQQPTWPEGFVDAAFELEAGEAQGPGQIIVRSVDGVEWGRCHFTITTWPERPVDIDASWATLSRTEITRGTHTHTRLRVGAFNTYGELLGAEIWPDVVLSGGSWISPLKLTEGGTLSGDIGPIEDADTITVTVHVQGQLLDTFTVTVTEAPAPADTPAPEEPAASDAPNNTQEASGGCASSDASQTPLPFALLLLALYIQRRFTRVAQASKRVVE